MLTKRQRLGYRLWWSVKKVRARNIAYDCRSVQVPHRRVSQLWISSQLPTSSLESATATGTFPGGEEAGVPDVSPSLAVALRALENTGLPWALLRGEDDLVRPSGDVDVLVSPEMLPYLDDLLGKVGFRRVLARGHGSHRFYFRYAKDEDLWIKLDIVSDVSFGRFQELKTELAEECLRRRVPLGSLWLPDPHDQAWLQILHLVLDKGEIAPAKVVVAREATVVASDADPIGAFLDRKLGSGTAKMLLELLRSEEFDQVPAKASSFKKGWKQNKGASWRISLTNRVLRHLSPRLTERGLVVGALAPDGAGKTTLLHGLRSGCPLPSAYVYMGLWSNSPHDRWLPRIPGGIFTRKIFRILRGGLVVRYHCLRGRIVLLDRLAFDAQLPGCEGGAGMGGLITSLTLRVQPQADLVLVLDAPGELMFARKGEHSPQILEEKRRSYLELAAELPEAVIIDAGEPALVVKREATGLLWDALLYQEVDEPSRAEALPLHLWMLLDWRFLLPISQPGKIGYGGKVSSDLVAAIQLLDPAASRIQIFPTSAPMNKFDVVLLVEPDAQMLERALASLRSNGWICLQVRRSFGLKRDPTTLAGWTRMLERAGFEDVAGFWHVPSLERPARVVPITSQTAVLHTLSHYSHARFGRAKAGLGRAVLALGLFKIAVPGGTVVGRRPARASEQERR